MRRDGELDEKRGLWRRGLCRWCLGEVAKRRTFCGPACVHEWRLRSDQGYVRGLVGERDGGICAGCRRDCVVLRRDLEMVATRSAVEFLAEVERLGIEKRVPGLSTWSSLALLERRGLEDPARRSCRDSLRLDLRSRGNGFLRTLWDADHVVAIEEGGGHGLDNLQTLCWSCHRAKTAEHARRRAERRRSPANPGSC